MARTALRSVSDAIEATRVFLLPLSVRRVASLAVVVLFMGMPGTPIPATPQFADPRFWDVSDPTAATNGAADLPAVADGVRLASPGTWPAWLLVGLGLGLLSVLVYLLLGTLLRFVLVEALGSDAVRIRSDGRRHLSGAVGVLGLRLLVWTLAASILAIVALVAVRTGGGGSGSGTIAVDRSAAVLLGGVATAVFALAWAIDVLTVQFVVPTMIATDSGVLAGWRRFWPTVRAEPVEYLLYGVVRIALGVAIGIGAAVAVLVVLGLAGVVLGTIAAIVVVVAGGFGSLGTAGLALLGVLVAIFALFAIAVTAAVAVPFQFYLWIYALLVLGDVDPTLDLIPDLRASARQDDTPIDPDDSPAV